MRIFLAIFFLFLTPNVFAIDYKKKNHINIGVDTFYRDYREDLVLPKKSNENGLLYGIALGYERKAPESIMFTFDIDAAFGKTHYDGSLQSTFGRYVCDYQSRTSNVFSNIDTQLGYTFVQNGKHLLTPFVGVGSSGWGRDLESMKEIYVWNYMSSGLQYDYNANKQYQYGLHVKIMQMQNGTMEIQEPNFNGEVTLGNKTHFEVSTPIIYKYNPNSKNYMRFTPYYQNQSFGESNWIPTGIPLAYLQEPASRTHIVGIKAEYAFGF